MKINPTEAVPFSVLAKQLKTKPTRGAVYHWYHHGLKNRRTGQIVKLSAVRISNAMGSTLAACEEFFSNLQ